MAESKVSPATDVQHDGAAVGYPDLKALREAKGLSLRDIFERTRISVVYLDAIEKRQYHLLPEPVYARTFIKNFALAIDADFKIPLDAYEQYLQSVNEKLRLEQEAGGARRKSQKKDKWVAGVLSALLAAIIIIILLAYHNPTEQGVVPGQPATSVQTPPDVKPAEKAPPLPSASPEAVSGQEKTVPSETLPPAAPQRESSQAAPPAAVVDKIPQERIRPDVQKPETVKSYRLFMEAREQVWLRIRQDRNRPEQVILEAGDTLERFAADAFTLDIGNAGGIDITFQDKPLGRIGKRGEVVHLRLP
jgi:cytoskeletal protein RodZ